MMAPSTSLDLESVRSFLRRYKAFAAERERIRVREFTTRFAVLNEALAGVGARAREVARRSAPEFNIFRVLERERREVTTHSRFLAHLLDPKASHGQGSLFLREFLVAAPIGLQEPRVSKDGWEVRPELPTWFGNIDIIIRCRRLWCCVIIENKIDAGDQEGQLARYYRWLKHSPYELSESRLMYLTIDGRNASRVALTVAGESRPDPDAEEYVRLMSYRDDIRTRKRISR
jgi:hypothetical protein